jgi:hypothetical protein
LEVGFNSDKLLGGLIDVAKTPYVGLPSSLFGKGFIPTLLVYFVRFMMLRDQHTLQMS